MIIKFVKVPALSGYFVFMIDNQYIFSTSLSDDDAIIRMGWDKEVWGGKKYIEFKADLKIDSIYNI
jgi:hypothetical protein